MTRKAIALAAMLLTAAASHAATRPAPRPAASAARMAPWRADPFPSTYKPLPRTDMIVVHANILDGTGKHIDDGEILVRDGKVIAIGHGLDRSGARVVDAGGRWVTPGIIDVHTHDGVYVLPLTTIDQDSSDVAELSDPNAADTWVETAINVQDAAFSRALEGGVTTIQVLPGSSPIFSGRAVTLHPIRSTTVSAMKVPGAPYGFKMACGENPKQQDAEAHHGPTSRQGEVAFIRNAFLDAQEYGREWDGYARGARATPPKRDLKREALIGLMRGDIRLNMHCYRSDDMATMMSVAKEFGFQVTAFHHATEAYKIADLLRDNGVCSAVWADWWGYKMEALDAIRADAPLLERAGACVTMHSDSPVSGQRLNVDAGAAAAAGRRAGVDIPPERVIRWVTSNPAKVLGLADRIGTLAPGFDADLVIWSASPFSVYTKADLVVIDGAVAFDRSAPRKTPSSDFELGRTVVSAQ